MCNNYDVKNFTFFKQRDLTYSTDSLTGVLSRDEVAEYVRFLLSNEVPFSFAIVDVDNFKTVNDTLGHLLGDRVLAIFA